MTLPARPSRVWSRTSPGERGALLAAAADRVAASADELALLTTREMGKPLGDARGGVDAGIGTLRQYAELGPLHRGKSLQGGVGQHRPDGVRATRRGRRDHAVERPVAVPCGLIGAAVVTRQHRGVQAIGAHAAHRSRCWPRRWRRLLPPGVLTVLVGDGDAPALRWRLTGRRRRRPCRLFGDRAGHPGGRRWPPAPRCCSRTAATTRWSSTRTSTRSGLPARPRWAPSPTPARSASPSSASTSSTPSPSRSSRRWYAVPASSSRPGATPDDARTARRRAAQGHGARAGGRAVHAGARRRRRPDPDGAGLSTPRQCSSAAPTTWWSCARRPSGRWRRCASCPASRRRWRLARRSSYGLAASVLTASMAHAQEAWRSLPVGTVKINAVFGGAPGGAAEPRRDSGSGFGYGPELLDEMTTTKVVHLTHAVTSELDRRGDDLVDRDGRERRVDRCDPTGRRVPSPCQRTRCSGRAGGPHRAGDTGPNSSDRRSAVGRWRGGPRRCHRRPAAGSAATSPASSSSQPAARGRPTPAGRPG